MRNTERLHINRSFALAGALACLLSVCCREPDGLTGVDGGIHDSGQMDDDSGADDGGVDDGGSDDAGAFDCAFDSNQDSVGPGPLCPEGSPDMFDNRCSPYFGGETSVDLEVAAFESFTCPHCGRFAAFAEEIWQRRVDYRQRVRFYFHNYTRSATDTDLHSAAAAAYAQGMNYFWSVEKLIVEGMNGDPAIYYKLEDVIGFADQTLKLDMEKFQSVLGSERTAQFLDWDKQQGKDAGMTGTPSVYICGKKISWPDLEAVVDGYLLHQPNR